MSDELELSDGSEHRSHRRYPQEHIDQLLSAADIVSVIGQHVDLRSSGRDEWKGLCPFHDDHRPSLGVNQTKGVYRCYSCNAKGNAISFIMAMEGLSFPESIRKLQQMTGIAPLSPREAVINTWQIGDVEDIEESSQSMEDHLWKIADIGGRALKDRPDDPAIRRRMMAVFEAADAALEREDLRTIEEICRRLPAFAISLSKEESR